MLVDLGPSSQSSGRGGGFVLKLSWVFILVMIVAPAVSRQLSDELKAWLPWLIRWLTERAVRRLPVDAQEHGSDEWPAHIDEVPGDLGKLVYAIWLACRCVRSQVLRGAYAGGARARVGS
jgi:hypothetical protein